MAQKKRNSKKITRRPITPIFRGVAENGETSAPGIPVYIGDRTPTESTYSLIQYNQKSIAVATPKTVEEVMAMFEPDMINWINVNGLASHADYKWLCAFFKLDPLTVEDMLNTEHRPKVEDFGHYIVVITKMLKKQEYKATEYEQISFILTKNAVLSFQEVQGDCLDPIRERLKTGTGRLRKQGSAYLLYGLLDVIVNNYYSILEDLGNRLEEFEEKSTQSEDSKYFMAGLQNIKTELNHMRRILWPVRDTINDLLHNESNLIPEEMEPNLRDLQENCIQVIEALESYRETASGIQEVFLSSVSVRMNEVMKVLTIISTIFIPLTFIVGVYGMNFIKMPELTSPWGYPITLGVMTFIAVGLIFYFKRKKWL
ncbi:MAG TPA: magnesium/cobalt transporter CorA [Treponemataceae bacterium]|nr:magnesium/cobalt transporter CorA [Treponemataceae bacterium]